MQKSFAKEEILSYLKGLKPELVHEGVSKIGLFGSFAKDRADIASDIDIVIYTTDLFKQNHPNFQAFIYLEDLRKKIERRFGTSADICDEAGLKNKEILEGVIYV